MRLELFAPSALMVVLLVLTGCQAAEELEALEPMVEVTVVGELAPLATKEAPTPEPSPVPPAPQSLIDPLTEREMAILRLMAEDLAEIYTIVAIAYFE